MPTGTRGKLVHYPLSQNYKTKNKDNNLKKFHIQRKVSFINKKCIELSYALENIHYDITGLSELIIIVCIMYDDCILCYIRETKGLQAVGFLIKKIHKKSHNQFHWHLREVSTTTIKKIQAFLVGHPSLCTNR